MEENGSWGGTDGPMLFFVWWRWEDLFRISCLPSLTIILVLMCRGVYIIRACNVRCSCNTLVVRHFLVIIGMFDDLMITANTSSPIDLHPRQKRQLLLVSLIQGLLYIYWRASGCVLRLPCKNKGWRVCICCGRRWRHETRDYTLWRSSSRKENTPPSTNKY